MLKFETYKPRKIFNYPEKDSKNKMKILWLYKYIPEYNFDHWLHMDFAETIAKQANCKLFAYGPRLHESNPELVPIKYNQNLLMGHICGELQPDAIIVNTKSRCFEYYNPHAEITKNCWLPEGFANYDNCPKIMLEEDYHYERNDTWYQEMRFNLILQRHYSQVKRVEKVPMQWLPFSVDYNIFHPTNAVKHERICMAGTVNGAYPERQEACRILRQHNLIDSFSAKEMIDHKYVNCLQSYVSNLCGSSRYHITPAKMFEIMACGSVLFTNEEQDLQHLFNKESYVTYNQVAFKFEEQIVATARKILHDSAWRQKIVISALHDILTRHTHEIRIQEMLEIIRKVRK